MSRKYPKNTEIHDLTPAEKNSLQREYDMDHAMVRGKFINHQQKNNPIRFPFRKYKNDPIVWYPLDINGKPQYFWHGKEYEIPLMVANHLNNKCYREVHQNAQDERGKPLPETIIGSKVHRFAFINTDFRQVDGWKEQTQLVTVKSTAL